MVKESVESVENRIKFSFHPYKFDEGMHAVEKAESGIKRKYLQGISSGVKLDGHDERMTENCIKSFASQAGQGDILLYPDVHGIKASNDIGILTKCEILKSGDWFTEYRLYDELDGIGAHKAEMIDTIWKQAKGLPPYRKPRQRGFSIEGYIPDGAILQAQKDEHGNLSRRIINDVLLDGVILCPRPAYNDSIANACYKALGEMHPTAKQLLKKDVKSKLREIVDDKELQGKYHQRKWETQDALDTVVEDIMKKNAPEKQDQLILAFDEYRDIMVELLMESSDIFTSEDTEEEPMNPAVITAKSSKLDVYKALLLQLHNLKKNLISKSGGIKNETSKQ